MPPDWRDSPRDEARSGKRRRSRTPPAPGTHPSSHAPHSATAPQSLICAAPALRGAPGPRRAASRRLAPPWATPRTPPPSHVRIPQPPEQHRASRFPRQPYASSTPSPLQRRSRSPGSRRARHSRPMSTFPPPHEQHRASRPPRRPYASSTPSPRQCRSRTSSSEPSPPKVPAHLVWWSARALRELHRWVEWAGGAGRREGVHMVHTLVAIRTRTPTSPNEVVPEAAMPQAAQEALLQDAVQGFRPPNSPETLRRLLRTTHPQTWAIDPPQPPPPPHHQHTGKGNGMGKGRAREGKVYASKAARRGPR